MQNHERVGEPPSQSTDNNFDSCEFQLRQQQRSLRYSSLTDDERETLDWSHERRLKQFKNANEDIAADVLESRLMYIDSLTIDNGEILEILTLNPTLTWERVREVLLAGPVDGYTSSLHRLDDINYPEHFWKVTIENQRERLTTLPGRPN